MKMLCVDDEELVLALTVSMSRELFPELEVEGFTRAGDALAWIDRHEADIALLDIDMPGMDGLMLAAKIKERRPDTAIIFLSGYSQYALDAIQLRASGYLLKPISREQLEREVEYALDAKRKEKRLPHILVQTFGEFDLIVDGQYVSFPRSRAKELLAYLVDRHGASVTRGRAFAVLWEDKQYDRRMQKQLDVVIRCLRSTLERYGVGEIMEMRNGSMRICPERLDCDLYRFIDGDIEAVNAYRGEYMSAYSWASLTEAYMNPLNGHL